MSAADWLHWAFGDRDFFCFWWLRGALLALVVWLLWWLTDARVNGWQLLVMVGLGAVCGALVWLVR